MSPKCPHPDCAGRVVRIGDGRSSYGMGEYFCTECNCEFYGDTAKIAIEKSPVTRCFGTGKPIPRTKKLK